MLDQAKYQRRFYLTILFAVVFLILWEFKIFLYPFTFLHEYGHNIMGGNPFPTQIWVSPDGSEGLSHVGAVFGETMANAGGFTGLLILAGLLQLFPVGIIKGFGIAAAIRATYGAIAWPYYGYAFDFSKPGVIQLSIALGIILVPLFVFSIFKGWQLNKLWDRKKLAKKQWEEEQERRRIARLNRIKTA